MAKTNDLKKGTRVKLNNGWEADLVDNRRGNTRDAKVYGDYTETGSVYSHDMVEYKDANGDWQPIEHTKAQLDCKAMNAALFGE